jgi:hypothetical protein
LRGGLRLSAHGIFGWLPQTENGVPLINEMLTRICIWQCIDVVR